MNRTIALSKYPFTPTTYPGRRPRFSFLYTRTGILRLTVRNLDRTLVDRRLAPPSERYAVLAYGSNACPGQLKEKGLSDVPVIFGRVRGAEAVYANRVTQKGYVPATLARKPGSRPSWITLLTDEQLRIMDDTEGRPNSYVLAQLANVRFSVGKKHFAPLYTYVNVNGGVMTIKGRPVSLRSMAQRRAKTLLSTSLERDAGTLLGFNVISSPNPPTKYSRLIGTRK